MKRILLAVLCLLVAGCAGRRPEYPQLPEPVEPMEVEVEGIEIEDEEVVILDLEETGEAEAEKPTSPRADLSWEEIAALGEKYTIQPGDTLSGVAARNNVGTGLLVRLNEIKNPNLIRVGQTLTVIEGPFRIEVDKSERTLAVYLGDAFIRSYPVALGKRDSTPEGEFQVLRKLENPPWTDPYHRTIVTADSPDYPLGTRWIEFIPPPGAYGIHGSRVAEEIGTEASFGCVRLLHPQEEEVYDFLTLGSPILIRP